MRSQVGLAHEEVGCEVVIRREEDKTSRPTAMPQHLYAYVYARILLSSSSSFTIISPTPRRVAAAAAASSRSRHDASDTFVACIF